MADESVPNGANQNQNENDVFLWREDSTRPAGFRRTLKIGRREYGFRWIPAGEFDRGLPEMEEGRVDSEKLCHVKLTRGFWMLETPTTLALYREVMCEYPSYFEGDDRPVECVSWVDATEFCAELTKRLPKGLKASLPTEAQWEYACRAGTTTAYWYGNTADADKMNYDFNVGETTPVKRYPANPWGLYDMHGNVCELCLDCFGAYPTGSVTDPTGPNSVSNCVFRGGGFRSSAEGCWSALRLRGIRYPVAPDNGFRFLLSCDFPSSPTDESSTAIQPVDESLSVSRPIETDASLWSESPNRPAGFRQTLKIGDAERGFCWIPAGEFDMGTPESEEDWEWNETLHHVKLTKGFWMLETPTTQELYKEVMGSNPSAYEGDDLPVETVSWRDATKFCAELTKRLPKGVKASLPTEAQWEYACRAGTTTPFSFGSVLNGDNANCNGNYPCGTSIKGKYVKKTTPVKSYDPNPWGLYDMSGNVHEWCFDYQGDYPMGSVTDPTGPNHGPRRVIRGGSWESRGKDCRSAKRASLSSCSAGDTLGFRFLLSCD